MSTKPTKPTDGGAAPADEAAPRLTGWKKWLLRVALMLLAPALFLLLLEGGLRLFGYGHPTDFLIKIEGRDAYATNPKFGWRFFPPGAARAPWACNLPATKGETTYRVFVLGGSAANGTPDSAFAFGRFLQVMLRERLPQTRFEVVNAAMVAINSHVVLPIARDCADHDADLFVVYLGNNEVVGPYGAGTVFKGFSPNLSLIRAGIAVRTARTGQLLANLMTGLGGEDEPREWGGMQMFVHNRVAADDPRLEGVYGHFRQNLTDIVRAGTDAGAKVILCTVATNLRDCPPFASLHRNGLTEAQRERWEALYREGGLLANTLKYAQAVERFERAAEIDDRYAELSYRLGQCRLALGNGPQARDAFVQAQELDALRFRCDSRLDQIIREVGRNRASEGVYLVDAAAALAAKAPDGLPGRELFFEHVHLTPEGNYLLAAEVFAQVVAALPESIGHQAGGDVTPPTQARCEELLALSGADRYVLVAAMARIMGRPPFTDQLEHERHLARLEEEKTSLARFNARESLMQIRQDYQAAIAAAPDDLELRVNLARIQWMLGDHPAVEKQVRWLLERDPNHAEWQAGLGDALFDQGRFAQALEPFRKAIRLKPDLDGPWNGLGSSLANLGRFAEAEEVYRDLLDRRPDEPQGHRRLGDLLARRGERDEAIEHYLRWSELEEDNPAAHATVADMLAGRGDVTEAIDRYVQAVQLAEKAGDAKMAEQIRKRLDSLSQALRDDPAAP